MRDRYQDQIRGCGGTSYFTPQGVECEEMKRREEESGEDEVKGKVVCAQVNSGCRMTDGQYLVNILESENG